MYTHWLLANHPNTFSGDRSGVEFRPGCTLRA
jgi:hypothetical protein